MEIWQEIRTVFEKQLVSFGDIVITPAVLLTIVLILVATFWVSWLA